MRRLIEGRVKYIEESIPNFICIGISNYNLILRSPVISEGRSELLKMCQLRKWKNSSWTATILVVELNEQKTGYFYIHLINENKQEIVITCLGLEIQYRDGVRVELEEGENKIIGSFAPEKRWVGVLSLVKTAFTNRLTLGIDDVLIHLKKPVTKKSKTHEIRKSLDNHLSETASFGIMTSPFRLEKPAFQVLIGVPGDAYKFMCRDIIFEFDPELF